MLSFHRIFTHPSPHSFGPLMLGLTHMAVQFNGKNERGNPKCVVWHDDVPIGSCYCIFAALKKRWGVKWPAWFTLLIEKKLIKASPYILFWSILLLFAFLVTPLSGFAHRGDFWKWLPRFLNCWHGKSMKTSCVKPLTQVNALQTFLPYKEPAPIRKLICRN